MLPPCSLNHRGPISKAEACTGAVCILRVGVWTGQEPKYLTRYVSTDEKLVLDAREARLSVGRRGHLPAGFSQTLEANSITRSAASGLYDTPSQSGADA